MGKNEHNVAISPPSIKKVDMDTPLRDNDTLEAKRSSDIQG